MMTEDDRPMINLHLPMPKKSSKDGATPRPTAGDTPSRPKLRKHDSQEEMLYQREKQYSSPAVKTDVKEVWFAVSFQSSDTSILIELTQWLG
jgi:hypothetical protein